eukprot:scaffold576_cov260-Pinguiococcus_pyrenoidosus.AAC.40
MPGSCYVPGWSAEGVFEGLLPERHGPTRRRQVNSAEVLRQLLGYLAHRVCAGGNEQRLARVGLRLLPKAHAEQERAADSSEVLLQRVILDAGEHQRSAVDVREVPQGKRERLPRGWLEVTEAIVLVGHDEQREREYIDDPPVFVVGRHVVRHPRIEGLLDHRRRSLNLRTDAAAKQLQPVLEALEAVLRLRQIEHQDDIHSPQLDALVFPIQRHVKQLDRSAVSAGQLPDVRRVLRAIRDVRPARCMFDRKRPLEAKGAATAPLKGAPASEGVLQGDAGLDFVSLAGAQEGVHQAALPG